jgi:cytochrome c oxidase cbb3-type subunit I/II
MLKHSDLEGKGFLMSVLVVLVISVGGLVEIIPLYAVKASVPPIAGVRPYTPLELEGRDIYLREGCYVCHSQMVRPFRDETERYGPYSKAGEFVYDHPFQWGSKRTGPDLHRVGGKYPDSWHYLHLRNPREVVPDSVMPNYPWLLTRDLDTRHTRRKLEVLRQLGVPYTEQEVASAQADLERQAASIAQGLKASIPEADPHKEVIALIAYLQRLGTDIGWRQSAAR